MGDDAKKVTPEEELKNEILKSIKGYVHDSSGGGKVDLSKVQVALDIVKTAYNLIIDAAAKQLTTQKLQ